ncbi:Uncharacterised protein [Mycobacteroides abscessus subsp. massiliense]|nr:Uncharacterised protein [Mycobacteroides abscessus subsp. massiliense]
MPEVLESLGFGEVGVLLARLDVKQLSLSGRRGLDVLRHQVLVVQGVGVRRALCVGRSSRCRRSVVLRQHELVDRALLKVWQRGRQARRPLAAPGALFKR